MAAFQGCWLWTTARGTETTFPARNLMSLSNLGTTSRILIDQLIVGKDARNQNWHTSLGDRGTTASMSCQGDIIRISQFLAAGHSEIFKTNHIRTCEPCLLWSRFSQLDYLSKRQRRTQGPVIRFTGARVFFVPNNRAQVRWVNWKELRYEWKAEKNDTT